MLPQSQSLFQDVAQGVSLGLQLSAPHIIHSYVKVPFGILTVLAIVYALNQALTLVNFPASVACMVICYILLVVSSLVFGSQKTGKLVQLFDIPGKFCLQWIAVFFTPAFITLPLSTPISAREALTIAAVFIVGFIVQMGGIAYFSVFVQWLVKLVKEKSASDAPEEVIQLDPHASTLRATALSHNDEESLMAPEFIEDPLSFIEEPPVAAQPHHASFSIDPSRNNGLFTTRDTLTQTALVPRNIIIGKWINSHLDTLVFVAGFIISIPIYFAIGYAMPLHLFTSVLTFLFMLHAPPQRYKMILNPVLCSVGLSWLIYYIFSAIKGENFLDDLTQYKTGRTYLTLFHTPHTEHITLPPGAGDVLSTLMDVSIVSLAMPMYTHRSDLLRNILTLIPTVLLMTMGSFFIYPPVCHLVGISSERSLGFAGRSITLALGTPFTESLGGSVPLMACTTVITAILGPLIGPFVLGPKMLRIREDDYVTRGATLGLSSGAITTAFLLRSDPRAAAMSSVCFVLFGTLMVAMASVPPLAEIVKRWVGL